MAGSLDERIMRERESIADGGEPLFTCTREVNKEGQNGTLKHTIPEESKELLGLTDADQVTIDIYQDGYVVRKADE